jgi:very-short-patch-repair endonuclease
MRISYDRNLKDRARKLRSHSTLSEVLLWNQLKQRKMLGYQFMRQKPIGHYIVDFYCSKLKLAIEIDGESHRDRFEKDRARQGELERLGISFLRFNDRDVKRKMRDVIGAIQGWMERSRSAVLAHDDNPRQPAAATPFDKGE